MTTHGTKAQVASVRPELTATLMAETGIGEDVLRWLVHSFYARVRADAVLGPVFASRISNWDAHLERMVTFWSSGAGAWLAAGRQIAFRPLARAVPRDGARGLHARGFRTCY